MSRFLNISVNAAQQQPVHCDQPNSVHCSFQKKGSNQIEIHIEPDNTPKNILDYKDFRFIPHIKELMKSFSNFIYSARIRVDKKNPIAPQSVKRFSSGSHRQYGGVRTDFVLGKIYPQ